jgi:hypothetical protein
MRPLKKTTPVESAPRATGSGVFGRLPRLQSSPDLDADASTSLSDFVAELARLSDWRSVPELVSRIDRRVDLRPDDAYVTTLVRADADIEMIVAMSALSEDDTLAALARLASLGLITIPAR